MRVHQIINSFSQRRGGAERIARRLHVGLQKNGIDAHLVAIEDCSTSGLSCATSFGFASAYDPRALMRLRLYVSEHVAEDDIVHVHLFPTSAHIALLSLIGAINSPCVFTEHNTWNRRRSHILGRYIDRVVYGQYARVFAISEGTAAELGRDRPNLRSQIDVVMNGADLHFDALPARDDNAVPKILAIGRLAPQKNFGRLLLALSHLSRGSFQCVILGEGDLRGELEAKRAELGLEQSVEMPGHIADPSQFMAEADIFVVPSLWEGFGLVAVEALNAGLPVVASDVPGVREIVGQGNDCAHLVDPEDPHSISDALNTLICDSQLRRRMGARGFARAEEFSTQKMIEGYIEAYKNLIGGCCARAC